MPTPRTPHPEPHRAPYRDTSGRALTDYPRPSLAVDTAVLTVAPRTRPTPTRTRLQLHVLLVHHPAHTHTGTDHTNDTGTGDNIAGPAWALPGTFLHPRERLADAVARSLTDKAHLHRRAPTTQLQVFDDPDRDPRGWVITVAHLAAIGHHHLTDTLTTHPDDVRLVPASRPGRLPYDHPTILVAAVRQLRHLYRRGPDPLKLLGSTFTIRELRQVHEAVRGALLQKDTFRRAMEPHLRPTDTRTSGNVGRPSQVFHRGR